MPTVKMLMTNFMRKPLTACLALALALALSAGAMAADIPVPTDTVVRSLNGVQEYIDVYTVEPGTDPNALIRDTFDYDGYTYSCTGIIKKENRSEQKEERTEVKTVETQSQELDAVLAALPVSIEYDEGDFSGVLFLDRNSITTEAGAYETRSYTVTEVQELGPFENDDPSNIPETSTKDGVTVNLTDVEWQAQETEWEQEVGLGVDPPPPSYIAIATYTGTGYYNAAEAYTSTAVYRGEVTSRVPESVTYTITYTGTPLGAGVLTDGNHSAGDTSEETAASLVVTEPNGILVKVKTTATQVKNNILENKWSFIGLASLLGLILLGCVLLLTGMKRGWREAEDDEDDFDLDDDVYYGSEDDS